MRRLQRNNLHMMHELGSAGGGGDTSFVGKVELITSW